MIEKQKLIDYINVYIEDCREMDNDENDHYIIAMQDILDFINRE